MQSDATDQVREKLLLAFCGAYVHRDFVQVGKGYTELTDWALDWLQRIRELYRFNRERLRYTPGTSKRAATEVAFRQHTDSMTAQRNIELADKPLRQP